MQPRLFYPASVQDLTAYWTHWSANVADLRQRKRDEFDAFSTELVAIDIATAAERAAFDGLFAGTNRKKLDVCPRVFVRSEIPLGRAA